MPSNSYLYFLVALIPMVVGFVYYHPAVMGKAWMKSNGFTMKDLEGGNMALIMGGAYFFSLLLAVAMTNVVIHQAGGAGMFLTGAGEFTPEDAKAFSELMATYGNRYRTFSHGALHGAFLAIMLALPIIAIKSNFERRGWKYSAIHFGYWLIALILMGGTLCATLEWAPIPVN